MSAFFLFDNIDVHDADKLAEYAEKAAPVVKQFGGRYRSVGGPVELMEGSWKPTYPVIIEFPSVDHAKAWYASQEYEPLKALRLSAVTSNAVLIEAAGTGRPA